MEWEKLYSFSNYGAVVICHAVREIKNGRYFNTPQKNSVVFGNKVSYDIGVRPGKLKKGKHFDLIYLI